MQSSTITPNGVGFDLDLQLANVGFARPFKQRNLYLVAKNTDTGEISTYLFNTDIRTWENTISITQSFDLGTTGTFQLYLWMPDKENSLASNPDYSIRLANENSWDATTGYNDLFQTVNLDILSVADVSFEQYATISPNPASDFIRVQLKKSDKERLQLYNLLGQLVREITVTNNQRIMVSELPEGMYFLQIPNKQVAAYKVIKR